MPTDFSRFTGLEGTSINPRTAVEAEQRFSYAIPAAERVFVDLSEQAVTSNIVRDGYQVPVAALDPTRYNDWIVTLPPPPKLELPRVVHQSIPEKRTVPIGTKIDLRLERPNNIPIDIFANVHEDLRGETVGAVAGASLFNNTPARSALLSYSSAAEVPPAEKALLTEAFGSNGVAIVEGDPAKSFERAFSTFRNAAAFR